MIFSKACRSNHNYIILNLHLLKDSIAGAYSQHQWQVSKRGSPILLQAYVSPLFEACMDANENFII